MSDCTEQTQDALKRNTMRVFNAVFIVNYVLMQIGAVILVRSLSFHPMLLGLYLFTIATFFEFLELVQPEAIMKLIPFWRYASGRGIVLCFLSVVAMSGSGLIGLMSCALSLMALTSSIFLGVDSTPKPLLSFEAPVDGSERSLLMVSKEALELVSVPDDV